MLGTATAAYGTASAGGDRIASDAAYQKVVAARERVHLQVFVIAAFTYLFLANSWLGDDAYITFRVVWNFLNGYGPVFNPGERVQAYTHPLWMLVLSAAHGVTREFFFTALAVSYGFAIVAVLVVVRSARSLAGGALAAITLFSSKAFIDYTSSGLENPLSFLLLALFYVRFCRLGAAPLEPRQLGVFGLLAGLAFVNRMDRDRLSREPVRRRAGPGGGASTSARS
jgi:arabinofuranosyltransferase